MPPIRTIYAELLRFSRRKPAWQQDALRRIIAHGHPTTADLDVALQLCRAHHGLTTPGSISPVPLHPSHLPCRRGPKTATIR